MTITIALTNNKLICDTMEDKAIFTEIEYFNGSYMDVLKEAKSKIKNGFILITPPFMGVAIPSEMPFKTLVFTDGDGIIDFKSLRTINYAIAMTNRALEANPLSIWSKNDLRDFGKIDLVVTERWLQNVYNRK